MFEIKLHFGNDLTLGHVRQFIAACEKYGDDYPVASWDENGEPDGLAVVVDNLG